MVQCRTLDSEVVIQCAPASPLSGTRGDAPGLHEEIEMEVLGAEGG